MQEHKAVKKELIPGSTHLYIIFGGIAAGIAMPPFEFYKSAKIINENKLFIRDFSQCWYHDGLPGLSNDIYSTAEFIKNEIDTINPDRVFFVGNSMGGYAALLFACLIGRGEVIAFAPQTFISPFLRLRYADKRWPKQMLKTHKRSLFKSKVWDLKVLLSSHLCKPNVDQKISVFVCKDDRLDYIHANHIKGIRGVSIYEFDGGGHEVAQYLRDNGHLPAILTGNYS